MSRRQIAPPTPSPAASLPTGVVTKRVALPYVVLLSRDDDEMSRDAFIIGGLA